MYVYMYTKKAHSKFYPHIFLQVYLLQTCVWWGIWFNHATGADYCARRRWPVALIVAVKGPRTLCLLDEQLDFGVNSPVADTDSRRITATVCFILAQLAAKVVNSDCHLFQLFRHQLHCPDTVAVLAMQVPGK